MKSQLIVTLALSAVALAPASGVAACSRQDTDWHIGWSSPQHWGSDYADWRFPNTEHRDGAADTSRLLQKCIARVQEHARSHSPSAPLQRCVFHKARGEFFDMRVSPTLDAAQKAGAWVVEVLWDLIAEDPDQLIRTLSGWAREAGEERLRKLLRKTGRAEVFVAPGQLALLDFKSLTYEVYATGDDKWKPTPVEPFSKRKVRIGKWRVRAKGKLNIATFSSRGGVRFTVGPPRFSVIVEAKPERILAELDRLDRRLGQLFDHYLQASQFNFDMGPPAIFDLVNRNRTDVDWLQLSLGRKASIRPGVLEEIVAAGKALERTRLELEGLSRALVRGSRTMDEVRWNAMKKEALALSSVLFFRDLRLEFPYED